MKFLVVAGIMLLLILAIAFLTLGYKVSEPMPFVWSLVFFMLFFIGSALFFESTDEDSVDASRVECNIEETMIL